MSTETDTQPLTAWEIALADSLLVDVDLDKDVPCAWLDPCDHPATWLLVNLCCGMTNPHCAEHREVSDVRRAECLAAGIGIECRKCRRFDPPEEWREL